MKSRKGVIIISNKNLKRSICLLFSIVAILLIIIAIWHNHKIDVSKQIDEKAEFSTKIVHAAEIEKVEKYITVWTTSNLNIRKEPNIDSKKMGQYEWGTKLQVTYINNEWAKEKKTGCYVNRTYLSEAEIDPDDFYWEAEFKLTAYCPCYECSEHWGHKTSTGNHAIAGRTIAVDPDIIPYGSEVTINGNTYIAEDCGGGVNGYHIDIFMNSHQSTKDFGVKYKTVRIWRK